MTFAWIEERRAEWPVTTLCRVLEVSRAGFYAWRSREPSETQTRRRTLTEQVAQIHAQVKARYGTPRMHAELVGRGHDCCVNTVARVMREAGVAAKTERKFRQTTDSSQPHPVAENVLDRDFDPAEPNASWVADVTYVPTREGSPRGDFGSGGPLGSGQPVRERARPAAVGGGANRVQHEPSRERHCATRRWRASSRAS